MNYRADIGGLRAIAILSVVLYHFKVPGLTGGFAGVDIFFVISGYLMSTIYLSKLDSGVGSIWTFYKARLLRIYPALLSVIVISYAGLSIMGAKGWMLDFYIEAKHALFFISNFFYNSHSGYFDSSADSRWLLHTWSLSVEWQFYIIYPIIVYAITRFINKSKIVYTYAALLIISFAACLYISKTDQNSAFYSLSTRGWELLAGSLVSVIRFNAGHSLRRFTECSGLILLMLSIFTLSSTGWPNALTIIPVVGASMVILANMDNGNSLLRSFIFQRLGDISYSLYLWHWIASAYINNADIEFSAINIMLALIFSCVCAVISYKFFERWSGKSVKLLAVVSSVCFVSLFSINNYFDKAASKITYFSTYGNSQDIGRQFNSPCFITSGTKRFDQYSQHTCLNLSPTKPNVLLFGDSHAAQLSKSLQDKLEDYNLLQATASGCLPYKDDTTPGLCSKLINFIYDDFIKNNKIDIVIMNAFWAHDKSDDLASLRKSIKYIQKSGAKVIVIGQTKSFTKPFYQIALQTPVSELHRYYDQNTDTFYTNKLEEMKSIPNVYIDAYDFNAGRFFDSNGNPLYFDRDHLTPFGAQAVAKLVYDSLEKSLN